jgi:hypothetical protein
MRTTIIFPPELMRAAKARSAERGESLKALLTRAVEAELGRSASPAAPRARVTLPLFGSITNAPPVHLSNADLARMLAEADAAAADTSAASAGRRSTTARRRKRSGR